jgi:pantothenate kinase
MTDAPPVLSPAAFAAHLRSITGEARLLVALAGAPGSGKTTIAARIAAELNAAEPGVCAVVPMDGFHLDDRILEARGWRPRKGAPHTFDVAGLAALLDRLRANVEDEIAFPVFDRDLELSRAAAAMAPRDARIVLVEGNYLLLDEAPWSALRHRFDLTAMTRCAPAEVEARLRRRWSSYGLPAEEIERRVMANDLMNARRVWEKSARPDFEVEAG